MCFHQVSFPLPNVGAEQLALKFTVSTNNVSGEESVLSCPALDNLMLLCACESAATDSKPVLVG